MAEASCLSCTQHRPKRVVVRGFVDQGAGLAAPVAGAGAAGARPPGAADPQLATAGTLAGVGDKATPKGGIRQVNRPIGRPTRRRQQVLIGLKAEK